MARVIAVTPDLMSGTRIQATLEAAGHEVRVVPEPPEEGLEVVDLLVLDLARVDPAGAAVADVPVLGFYPHVEVELRRRAEQAGIATCVPRSRFFREMPELVGRAAGGAGGSGASATSG